LHSGQNQRNYNFKKVNASISKVCTCEKLHFTSDTIFLLLTALLGSTGAEDIDLGYGMRGTSSGGFIGNCDGFRALRAIVTGIAHSGTNVTAAILFNAPCVLGALETGFLLAKKPGK